MFDGEPHPRGNAFLIGANPVVYVPDAFGLYFALQHLICGGFPSLQVAFVFPPAYFFCMVALVTPAASSRWGADSGFRGAFVANLQPRPGSSIGLRQRLFSAIYAFPSTSRWLVLGGATAALAPSILGLHGQRSDAHTPRLSVAELTLMVPIAGFSSTLLSGMALNRPGLRGVPITGGEAFAFAAIWYWYLMSAGEEADRQGQRLSAASRGLFPELHQVVWAARRLIEGIAICNVAALVRGIVQVRRVATAQPAPALAAQAAIRNSPLPTLRPFGIPAIVGMLVSSAIYRLRISIEPVHDNIPGGGV